MILEYNHQECFRFPIFGRRAARSIGIMSLGCAKNAREEEYILKTEKIGNRVNVEYRIPFSKGCTNIERNNTSTIIILRFSGGDSAIALDFLTTVLLAENEHSFVICLRGFPNFNNSSSVFIVPLFPRPKLNRSFASNGRDHTQPSGN
jgi:hypothetical protein